MRFFLDTADINVIRDLAATGFVDGVTTNPSLIAKSGRDFKETIAEICAIIDGPISAEVVALNYEAMLAEAKELTAIHRNVTIKLPLTMDGLKACRTLSTQDIMVNVTLCFSAAQALLAAKAGATFISPFIGRLDDINESGLGLIQEIRVLYDNYAFATEILAASIRSPRQVVEVGLIGADVVTMPPSILHQLAQHPLTDKGIEIFMSDWKKTGQQII